MDKYEIPRTDHFVLMSSNFFPHIWLHIGLIDFTIWSYRNCSHFVCRLWLRSSSMDRWAANNVRITVFLCGSIYTTNKTVYIFVNFRNFKNVERTNVQQQFLVCKQNPVMLNGTKCIWNKSFYSFSSECFPCFLALITIPKIFIYPHQTWWTNKNICFCRHLKSLNESVWSLASLQHNTLGVKYQRQSKVLRKCSIDSMNVSNALYFIACTALAHTTNTLTARRFFASDVFHFRRLFLSIYEYCFHSTTVFDLQTK